ncbi:hypothetical protein [Flavobacterium pectinovorum]|uniref:Glycosyltransferase RgtA/B/C/D-like domain-containing protein n=1 Tax=Flavobacterium pectinovorum TaxID=29533 RepID=A0AB36P5V3_9FLAO|nr:hypothetical protein [Flavobacterium pectinovorum]OXB07595.1 hypothetical protein B0A72_01650 [Flavobacterium pectinovorum]SHM73430.1 hypothetical protein SAMN05444387_3034 [Flavobacterium pectinovorum]
MKNNYFVLGFGLLTVPFLILFLSSILFILGFSLNSFVFPVSIFLSSIMIYNYSEKKRNNLFLHFKSVFVFLLIILFSLLLSFLFWDYSYDGQSYHQTIICVLKDGWNPIYNHHSGFETSDIALWVDHYAKGVETIAACIYSTTGNIECGKAVNFIIIIASFFFALNLLDEYFSFFKLRKKIFISFLLSISPVVICQFLTYYIDWSLYSLLLILISTLFLQRNINNYFKYFTIVIVIYLSTAIKFNILFFTGFVIFVYLCYLLVSKDYVLFKNSLFISFSALLLAICTVGINPYITNTIDHKNPFYPLLGGDSVDIMTNQTPINMRDKSRVESIFISLFSETNALKTSARVVFPFYLSTNAVKNSGQPDVRAGGFGVFFSGILVLSSLLYVFSSVKEVKRRFYLNGTLLLLFLSIFILPSGWWARYVPFFYTIPIVMLLYSECSDQQSSRFKYLRYSIYCFMFLNIGVSFLSVCAISLFSQTKTSFYLNVVSASAPVDINFDNNTAFKIKLDESKIDYKEARKQALNFEILSPTIYLKEEQLKYNKVEKPWLLKILKK